MGELWKLEETRKGSSPLEMSKEGVMAHKRTGNGEADKPNLNPLTVVHRAAWIHSMRRENETLLSLQHKIPQSPIICLQTIVQMWHKQWGRLFKAQSKMDFLLSLRELHGKKYFSCNKLTEVKTFSQE